MHMGDLGVTPLDEAFYQDMCVEGTVYHSLLVYVCGATSIDETAWYMDYQNLTLNLTLIILITLAQNITLKSTLTITLTRIGGCSIHGHFK